ncbi:hypothetical protein [Burkholderia territorii]|uniref:hypothetical protein n=1 Tax=Burkholderia territorii TaxID=1503055 RepID=UPI00075B59B4|nr:hypothetical protein [Burkholderia territorii]KWA28246.1 hypothetical protein WT39_14630 [Burkholderia territorii]
MSASCAIQLHAYGSWHDVGVVTLFDESEEGSCSRAYTGYDVEWVVRHQFARDAHAMACGFPVDLEPLVTPHWPAFLIDLLPQGVRASEAKAGTRMPRSIATHCECGCRQWRRACGRSRIRASISGWNPMCTLS